MRPRARSEEILLNKPEIKFPATSNSLNRRLQRIHTVKQGRQPDNVHNRFPIRHGQRAHSAPDIAPWMRTKRIILQLGARRITRIRIVTILRFRSVCKRDQIPLQAQHHGFHPLLALDAELVAVALELFAVFLSVSDRVAGWAAVVAGFETLGVELAVVGAWIRAFIIDSRACGGAVAVSTGYEEEDRC